MLEEILEKLFEDQDSSMGINRAAYYLLLEGNVVTDEEYDFLMSEEIIQAS